MDRYGSKLSPDMRNGCLLAGCRRGSDTSAHVDHRLGGILHIMLPNAVAPLHNTSKKASRRLKQVSSLPFRHALLGGIRHIRGFRGETYGAEMHDDPRRYLTSLPVSRRLIIGS